MIYFYRPRLGEAMVWFGEKGSGAVSHGQVRYGEASLGNRR